MAENDSNQVGGFLVAFALGAVAGAGVALLFAPRSGKETRERIAEKSRDIKNKVTDAMAEVPGFIEEKRASLSAAIDSGKEAVRDELNSRFKNA